MSPEPAEEEEEERPETIEEGDEKRPPTRRRTPEAAEEDAPSPPGAHPERARAGRRPRGCARWSRSRRRSVSPCRWRRRRRALPPARVLNPSDAIEATGLLVRLRQFGVDGADEGVRRMLALVFSRDTAVRDAAVEAVDVLFLAGADSPVAAAAALADVAAASALGELAALEEVIKLLVADGRVPPTGAVIRALWAQATAKELPDESRAAAFTVLAMAAARTRKSPPARRLRRRRARARRRCKSGVLARAPPRFSRARPGGNAGTSKSDGVAAPALEPDAPSFAALARCLPASTLRPRVVPAAEQSIAALYALHPDPEGAASDVVRSFAAAAFPAEDHASSNVRAATSRFLFVLGEVGFATPRARGSLARAVRSRASPAIARRRGCRGGGAKGETHGEEAEPAAALGRARWRRMCISTTPENARGGASRRVARRAAGAARRRHAPVVVALCGHPAVATGHPLLRGAALAALSRLMAIDAAFAGTWRSSSPDFATRRIRAPARR